MLSLLVATIFVSKMWYLNKAAALWVSFGLMKHLAWLELIPGLHPKLRP